MMTPVMLFSWVGVVLGLVATLAAAAFVAIVGRGPGRWLAVGGLVLAAVHTVLTLVLSPLRSGRGADLWTRYAMLDAFSVALTLITWGLVGAGIILLSRERLRRRGAGASTGVAGGWPGNPASPYDPQRHPSGGATAAPFRAE